MSKKSSAASLKSSLNSHIVGVQKNNKKTLTPKVSKKRPRWQRFLIAPFYVVYWMIKNPVTRYGLLLLIAVVLLGFGFLLQELPSPRRLTSGDNFSVSTQIFDRNGVLLYEIFADENRTPIELETLPLYVAQATIAIEDKHFYSHHGFDFIGISRAALSNLGGGRLEGGSTITQQLVKNALLTRERSYQRKIKEAILSIITEIIYSKDEILEMYLNYIPYGGTAVGIEAASQQYFGKPARELTVSEAALLAGLPQAPSLYSPFGSNPELAKSRQNDVLRRMTEDGYLTEDVAVAAHEEVLSYALSRTDIKAPHFVFYVRDLLYDEYGVETVERGGLRVTTTLDLDLHNVAQASLSAEINDLERYKVTNGAALIVKPNTGEILSMIGSRDYFNATAEGQVNVTIAQRQPGSSIKPIMYATALQEKKLNPGSILIDSPTCFTNPGQEPYCPKNYDGSFKGPVTLRKSLGNSLNIPAVKALRTIGIPTFIDQATAMGITTWKDPKNYGLSLSLGGGEVRMIDLVQAFSVLANQGVKTPLTPILRIEDYRGKELKVVNIEERKQILAELTANTRDKKEGDLERVMDRAPAYLTSHIMQDNTARVESFGSRSELVIPDQIVSAKTGTTNDLRDNWTVGFTPEYLVMTWVGNNDNQAMNSAVVSGVTGAAPIFNDIMSYILGESESVWQEKPPDVVSATVCETGFPAQEGKGCLMQSNDMYWKSSEPSVAEFIRKETWIDPKTGVPPAYGEQIEGLVLEEHTIVSDPVTELYCLDCNRAVTEEGRVIYEQRTVTHDYQLKEN